MTTSTKRLQKGFTLIELLTVIAIIGILAAIIIPTVGKVRETAQRSVASSNLRQVGQASLIYATDNNDRLPATNAVVGTGTPGAAVTTMNGVFFQLAYGGGLNDASIWFTGQDNPSVAQSTVMNSDRSGLLGAFTSATTKSYVYVVGLLATDPSTSPISWTRGLNTSGAWVDGAPWKTDGGHVVFLGGNVAWYRNTSTDGNKFISRNGSTSVSYEDALPGSASAKRASVETRTAD